MAASTAARKAPAKKRTAAAAGHDGEARASVILDPDREAPAPDMFPIFAIGNTQYYAPVNPGANVELKFLWMMRHEGEAKANAYLLETLVGTEGFKALMEYDALEKDDLEQIFGALQRAVEGAATGAPKGGLRIT